MSLEIKFEIEDYTAKKDSELAMKLMTALSSFLEDGGLSVDKVADKMREKGICIGVELDIYRQLDDAQQYMPGKYVAEAHTDKGATELQKKLIEVGYKVTKTRKIETPRYISLLMRIRNEIFR